MRLMKPRPLKFRDVLHSTPAPRRCANAPSRSCRPAFVSWLTVCTRAEPSTCVTAPSSPVFARPEVEHVGILEASTGVEAVGVLDPAHRRDRAIGLADLDLVERVRACAPRTAPPGASGCRARAGRSPSGPAPTPLSPRPRVHRPARRCVQLRLLPQRRVRLVVPDELQTRVHVPVDVRLAGERRERIDAPCRARSPSRPCTAARIPTRSARARASACSSRSSARSRRRCAAGCPPADAAPPRRGRPRRCGR